MQDKIKILLAVYGTFSIIETDKRLSELYDDGFLFLFDTENDCVSVISKEDLINSQLPNTTGEIFSKNYER